MAIGKVDVINAALLLIGAEKLTATTDATKAARLATSMYDIALREVHDLPIDWRFATARAELAQMSDAPIFGEYDYQYELPAKCRRILAVVDEAGDKTEYEWGREVAVITSGGRDEEYDVFLANQDEAFIKYIRLREDPNKWPGYFIRLVYLTLAILLCEPLKQDKQKKNQLMLMYDDAYNKARTGNGMENADTSDDGVRLDLGNTEIVDAATIEEVSKKYIEIRSS